METIRNLPLKRKIGALIGILLFVLAALVPQYFPGTGSISVAGLRIILVLAAFLIMLVLEVLPVVVTSLLFTGMMPLLKVTDGLGGALSGFSNPVVFFTLASFGIAMALTEVPLSKRILAAMLNRFGKSIETVLLALMSACCLSSALVSNVPCCAVFMSLALSFLSLYPNEEDRQKTGKVLMIAIPVSSMIGGMITPVGSSVNLIAMQQLTAAGYPEISFVRWMACGLPMAVILLPTAWWLLIKLFHPVQVTRQQIEQFIKDMNVPKKIDSRERKVIVITLIMIALWVLSSWVPAINTMVVAILGCALLFVPGIDILKPERFLRENSWDSFFLVGTVISISAAMNANGVGSAIAGAITGMLPQNISPQLFTGLCSVIIFLALIAIPVATSLIPLMLPVLIKVAETAGIPAVLVTLAVSVCACNCYLLPLDTVALITYGKGYYRMTDMFRCTVFLQIILVLLCSLYLPLAYSLFIQ